MVSDRAEREGELKRLREGAVGFKKGYALTGTAAFGSIQNMIIRSLSKTVSHPPSGFRLVDTQFYIRNTNVGT